MVVRIIVRPEKIRGVQHRDSRFGRLCEPRGRQKHDAHSQRGSDLEQEKTEGTEAVILLCSLCCLLFKQPPRAREFRPFAPRMDCSQHRFTSHPSLSSPFAQARACPHGIKPRRQINSSRAVDFEAVDGIVLVKISRGRSTGRANHERQAFLGQTLVAWRRRRFARAARLHSLVPPAGPLWRRGIAVNQHTLFLAHFNENTRRADYAAAIQDFAGSGSLDGRLLGQSHRSVFPSVQRRFPRVVRRLHARVPEFRILRAGQRQLPAGDDRILAADHAAEQNDHAFLRRHIEGVPRPQRDQTRRQTLLQLLYGCVGNPLRVPVSAVGRRLFPGPSQLHSTGGIPAKAETQRLAPPGPLLVAGRDRRMARRAAARQPRHDGQIRLRSDLQPSPVPQHGGLYPRRAADLQGCPLHGGVRASLARRQASSQRPFPEIPGSNGFL